MIEHKFVCDICGFEIFDTNTRIVHKCKNCKDSDMRWELNNLLAIAGDNERWSVSMGVPESQVEEFRKRFPKSTYDDNGRLLIKNRKDKLRQASERNFVELN